MFFRQAALLATAILPLSFAQVSEDFEGGWDETAWPIYAPDCNQVRLYSLIPLLLFLLKKKVCPPRTIDFCVQLWFLLNYFGAYQSR